MADSDIQVTALTASQAGPGAILVAPITSGGSCLPYLALAAVEIWGGSSSNVAGFTMLGDTITGFVHSGLAASTTRYYRARARDASGNYGDWYPSSGSVSATTSTVTPGPNSIGSDELKDNAVTTPKLNGGAVTNAKLGSLSVGSANMQNAAVDTAHIVDAAIVRAKIGSAAVGTANIENGAITRAKIGSAAIGTAQIDDAAITNAKIGNLVAEKVVSGIFTGLTFQTAPSGTRCVISAETNRFSAYNGSSYVNIGGTGSTMIDLWAASNYGAIIRGNATAPETPLLAISNEGEGGIGAVIGGRGTGASHGARIMGKAWWSASDGQAPATSPGGSIVLGVGAGGGGWAAFSEKGGFGPFTGGHDAFIAKGSTTEIGDIVCDLKVVARNGVDDTVTEVYVAEDDADPAAVGVVSRRMDFDADALMASIPDSDTAARQDCADRYDRLAINSVGEGQVNVCGRGGDIRAGDLIMTSTLRGKGQRQPDGIVRNYTVAKAREDVTFSGPDDVKRCACIYHAG